LRLRTLEGLLIICFAGGLAPNVNGSKIPGMKFLAAIIAFLVIGLLLAWGILLAVKGQAWLLVVGLLAYGVAFAKLGCLPKQSH
jgi:hypothetical protein